MATITRNYTYTAGSTINPDENNANENALFNAINGNLDNDNIDSAAGIVESKITFATDGHGHTGGTDGKLIPKGYMATVTGTLTTGTSVTPALVAIAAQTFSKVYVYAKTAPTGADLIVDININGTSIWNTTQANRATIAAGDNLGTGTDFDTTTISDEDVITIDIDSVGSSEPGKDLTIELR